MHKVCWQLTFRTLIRTVTNMIT